MTHINDTITVVKWKYVCFSWEVFMQNKDNYLKNAEMSTEQNYNMIDGILNNARSSLLEPPEKPLDKVKEYPPRKRSREREER